MQVSYGEVLGRGGIEGIGGGLKLLVTTFGCGKIYFNRDAINNL